MELFQVHVPTLTPIKYAGVILQIWDADNSLVRELSFGGTLQGVCFANPQGDILAGFERHVV